MTPVPRVSVIIPHYRDLQRLRICLDALARQTLESSLFEIIVADNASPEGPRAIEAVIGGRARLIVVSERGAGPARNGAVAAARGEILAFVDSDCKPEPEWLEGGLKALDEFDFVGGKMYVTVQNPQRMSAVEAFEAVFAFDNHAYVTRDGFTVTANLFCPRALFEAVGGFKTGVSEDMEWCHRASAAGFRLGYAPEAVVGHPARTTWSELLAKTRRINREFFLLTIERRSGRLKWLVRSLLLPVSAVIHAPRVLFSSELRSLRDKLAALVVLFRLRAWRCANSMSLLVSAQP